MRATKPKLGDTVNEIREDIVKGRALSAQPKLKKLLSRKVPRAFAPEVAGLARRGHAPDLALRLLYPILHPTRPLSPAVTDRERIEYAASLIGVGAIEEADWLLDDVGSQEGPATYVRGLALLARWQFEEAIGPLGAFVDHEKHDAYARCNAEIDLALSLSRAGQKAKATELLARLLATTESHGWALLHARALRLSFHGFLRARDVSQASQMLERARTAFGDSDPFFVKRGEALVALVKQPNPQALAALAAVRQQAEDAKLWEAMRECDHYRAIMTRDQRLFVRLMWGTPFVAYRREFSQQQAWTSEIPTTYDWSPGVTGGERIDIASGETSQGGCMEPGTPGHTLLAALASDFYAPQSVASLHFKLCPGEYFNPTSSPGKVSLIVARVRKWLKKEKLDLIIEQDSVGYRFSSKSLCTLWLSKPETTDGKDAWLRARLTKKMAKRPFSLSQAADALHASAERAQRFLESESTEGRVTQTGQGKRARYRYT